MNRAAETGHRPSRPTFPRGIAFAIAFLISLVAFPSSASAYVYWLEGHSNIGRANLDGTGSAPLWLSNLAVDLYGLASDAGYLYFPNSNSNSSFHTIGRVNIDGSGGNVNFVDGLIGQGLMWGIAVDSSHIYWTDIGRKSIGRSNLDGTGANLDFIQYASGQLTSYNIAVDGSHIYWSTNDNWIARANLDGSGVEPNFIEGHDPRQIAVDSTYIYWANFMTSGIGRANLDGSSPDQNFITTIGQPLGVAVHGGYIYWSIIPFPNPTGTIGRANLDGTGVDYSFITDVQPSAMVVGSELALFANGFD